MDFMQDTLGDGRSCAQQVGTLVGAGTLWYYDPVDRHQRAHER